MAEKLQFVLVGLGGFGQTWCSEIIPKISDIMRLVAAVDINPAAFAYPVSLCGLAPEKCYTDLNVALIENKADFIVIVTPPAFHEQAIDIALEHGCDIVCEKPYAGSMAAGLRIYHKVKRAGRKMVVTMNHRMDRDKQTLESLLRSGKYGKINYIVGRLAMTDNRVNAETYRDGHNKGACGIISEVAIHQMDIMRALSGSNAKTVYAWVVTNSCNRSGTGLFGVDNVFVDILMENGVRAFSEHALGNAVLLNGWTKDYIRVECDKAELLLDNRAIEVRSDLEPNLARRVPLLPGGDEMWAHCLLLRRFAEWLGGGPEPLCSLEDNLQCAAMAYAAVESCETGAPVDVQDFLRRHNGDKRRQLVWR